MADPTPLPEAVPPMVVPSAPAEPEPLARGERPEPGQPEPESEQPPSRPRRERRPAPLGRIALLVAVVMVALVVVALQIDAPTRYLAATVLAYAAIALSVVAVVLGLVAVVRGRQRGVAIAALVIAVLGDPLVLLYGLGALT